MRRVLPTHAFHVVFTLPSELRRLVLGNRRLLFDLLFACAAETLLELGRDPRWLGAELGITSVLHTWTRELLFHPHVHCVVTGGGLSLDGQHWICTRKNFLFPVRVLGALFRGKFLARLRQAHTRGRLRLAAADAARDLERLCERLQRKRWVVYSKPPFGGPEHVFRYLGRYTHRVGLSNRRLVSFDPRGVTFRTRGTNIVTVSPDEFLRRFVLHVLPKGFVKIRHHGLMAASHVSTKLEKARRLLERTPAIPRPAPHDFRTLLVALHRHRPAALSALPRRRRHPSSPRRNARSSHTSVASRYFMTRFASHTRAPLKTITPSPASPRPRSPTATPASIPASVPTLGPPSATYHSPPRTLTRHPTAALVPPLSP
jgi:hypothetical protein